MLKPQFLKPAGLALGGAAALFVSALSMTATAQIIYSVPGNTPPVAVASTATPSVAADASGIATVTLSGVNSSDVDGFISLYKWDGDFLEAPLSTGGVTVTVTLAGVGPHIITLTVVDDLGDPSDNTDTITINVTGAPPPTLVTPASNLSVSCSSDPAATILAWLNNNGGAVVDPSAGITWSNTYSGLVNGSASVTFTATNSAGVSVSTTALITADGPDTIAPVIAPAAADTTVECDGTGNWYELNAWLASHGGARATDNCSTVTWTNNFNDATSWVNGTCPIEEQATVTFTATDASGNSSSTTATFKVKDTTAPPLVWTVNGTVVPDYSINTFSLSSLPVTVKVYPADLCGGATLQKSFSWLQGSGSVSYSSSTGGTANDTVKLTSGSNNGKVRFYFKATDECGNSSATEWIEIDLTNQTVKLKGNEGLGNGVDPNTPGALHNGNNDAPGFFPGNPGAKHKNN